MESKNIVKASILTIALVTGFIICIEMYWRLRGFTASYNDDKVLWATKRNELRQLEGDATVFLGGSRIKFDLDVATWEKITGERAIQLAIVGTPSRLTLRDLAKDKNFKGKIIVDVAEMQFFGSDTVRRDRFAREALQYHHDETPAQKASAWINHILESKLVFLEEGKFGLINLLNSINLVNRKGAVFRPVFPFEFSVSNFDRQTRMTRMFLESERLIKIQTEHWKRGMSLDVPPKENAVDQRLAEIEKYSNEIRSRGGVVVFIRPPSGQGYIEYETKNYPRHQYWDKILRVTGCDGIHFADYNVTSRLVCPEWSHLRLEDAAVYTQELVRILHEEKGWVFPNSKNFRTKK